MDILDTLIIVSDILTQKLANKIARESDTTVSPSMSTGTNPSGLSFKNSFKLKRIRQNIKHKIEI